MIVGFIYRSGSESDGNNRKVGDLLEEVGNLEHTHMLMMGNFNYRDINWSNWTCRGDVISEEYKFVETLQDHSLYQCVLKYTKGKISSAPSFIDLIISNKADKVYNIQHTNPLGEVIIL